MLKKDPLGKGLSAILKDVEEKGTSKLIPVEEITPNPTQPRLLIKEDTLVELAASIREKGVLQPLLLRKDGKGYEIIAGERRFRAAVMAGLREVPAIIKDVDEKESAEIALIENLQREDLNPIEIASVYERFIEDFSYTQEKLAKKIGIDRATISNFVRLLKLPEWIKQLIREAKLTQGHARVLVTLKNEAEQKKFVEKILKENISVRDLEREAKKKSYDRQSQFSNVEESLKEVLGTIGQPAKLDQSLSGSDYTFTWYKNLDQKTNTTSPDLNFSSVEESDYATYTAEAYTYSVLDNSVVFDLSLFREPISLVKVLGTEESAKYFNIYPNPTSEFLNIVSTKYDIQKVHIYDLSGKQILSESKSRIDVSKLPSGVYMLIIKTQERNKNFKFIKQ